MFASLRHIITHILHTWHTYSHWMPNENQKRIFKFQLKALMCFICCIGLCQCAQFIQFMQHIKDVTDLQPHTRS